MCRLFFFVKQKTAYDVRISDWSSDVCSSDLLAIAGRLGRKEVRCPVAAQKRNNHAPARLGQEWRDVGIHVDVVGPTVQQNGHSAIGRRSEERRVGKECVSTCSSCLLQYHSHKHMITITLLFFIYHIQQ